MNKEEKFLAYLEALKTAKNTNLLEGVINGFKTLVEYRVDGNISERQVDIMENSEDIEDMVAFDDSEMEDMETSGDMGDMDIPLDESTSDVKGKIFGKNSDAARHAKFVEDQNKKVAKGIAAAGAKNRAAFAALNEEEGGTSEESNAVSDEEPIMEVGEGEVKGKLNPALLRQIDDAIEKDIQKMSMMIDRQKLVVSAEEKNKYLTNMRGQKWRDELISLGVDPSTMRGLIPALSESLDEANVSLLESVTILKMVVDK